MSGINLYAVFFFTLMFNVIVRGILVGILKSAHFDLWTRYGSPHVYERDYFFMKFPYVGVFHSFKVMGFMGKVGLVLFVGSNAALILIVPLIIIDMLG